MAVSPGRHLGTPLGLLVELQLTQHPGHRALGPGSGL